MLNTKIFLSSPEGDTIINDFEDDRCLECVTKNYKSNIKSLVCPLNFAKKHTAVLCDKMGCLYVCDGDEKTAKNFNTLVALICHSRKALIETHHKIADDIRNSTRKELNAFKHNIEHINSDAINEFYSFITQEELVKNYSQLLEIIESSITNDKQGAINLIARLAKYNLNIKTELSIISRLDNPNYTPILSKANPRDAIMSNIYMLYPLFRERNVYVKVEEYWNKFKIDYDAVQVATYYIIENATKYSMANTQIIISFKRESNILSILFIMCSLFIEELDEKIIFNEGFKGDQARRSGKSGKGIGLYRAKRLINSCGGKLYVEGGADSIIGEDNLKYANNKFIIELPILS